MSITPHSIELEAADGYRLGGTLYAAQASQRARLIVAGATAVPQAFYRRFALHAAARGFEVLSFDYRGIGLSKPATLKGFRMNLLDWGRLDLAAAVDAMPKDLPLFIVGHSLGGHAVGLLPNHQHLAGCYVFGTGAGWHGHMPLGERLKVQFLWNVVAPVLTRWKGYGPWKMLGMGEDIPIDVYRQWRHWCRYPHYFFDDPAMRGIEQPYAAIHTPIVAANALDDLWALPVSRDAFMQGYRNAPVTRLDLDPTQVGGSIGHMGYFRAHCEPLWDAALAWCLAQQDKPAAT